MNREQILDQWLYQTLKTADFQKVLLAGDASFRRYYRIFVTQNKQQYVLMDAPPPEEPKVFMEMAHLLGSQGLSVPTIVASQLDHGFLLLSDLGDRLYLPELTLQSADTLYGEAFQALLKIQSCQAKVPVFDRAFLKRQYGIFQEWFLGKHKGVLLTDTSQNILETTYERLLETIDSQPQVFVHRDYHSRNLMILEAGSPGVLDFQDAMIGPITYDLVSLLQDCYITWPREHVVGWVKNFQQLATQKGLLSKQVSTAEFVRWFDWTGLQRHLKNLGIFSRLYYRDGKSQYLNDLPRVLQYIQETSVRYPELNPLWTLFEDLKCAQ